MKKILLSLLAIVIVCNASFVFATNCMDGHGTPTGAKEAMGTGVIEAVMPGQKMITITHDPIEKLNWGTMTMDLPVTNRVDLSAIQKGDAVDFHLKLGHDKKYRIIMMKKK